MKSWMGVCGLLIGVIWLQHPVVDTLENLWSWSGVAQSWGIPEASQDWVADFTPLVVLAAAVFLRGGWGAAFVLCGGLLRDIMIPVALGSGPLLFLVVFAFIKGHLHSDRPVSWWRAVALGWIGSLLFLAGDRAIFMLARGAEIWPWESILAMSLVNGVVAGVMWVPLRWWGKLPGKGADSGKESTYAS